jgi:hypothetical protein
MHECADLGRTVGCRFLEMENVGVPKSRARIPFPAGRSRLGCDIRSILADRGREDDMMLLPMKRWKNVVSTNLSLPI